MENQKGVYHWATLITIIVTIPVESEGALCESALAFNATPVTLKRNKRRSSICKIIMLTIQPSPCWQSILLGR